MVLAVLLGPGTLYGGEVRLFLGDGMLFFPESSKRLSVSEARREFTSGNYSVGQTEILTFGYTDKSYWFYEKLAAESFDGPAHLILDYALLDDVELHVVQGPDHVVYKTGDKFLYKERPVVNPAFVFPLNLSKNVATELFLRVSTSSAFQVPLRVVSESTSLLDALTKNLIMGMYFGVFAFMVLYNFLIYQSTRQRLFALYVAFVLSWGLFQAAIRGYGYAYLWPESPNWNTIAPAVLSAVTGMAIFVFIRDFLKLSQRAPRLAKLFSGIGAFFAVMIVASFVLPYSLCIRLNIGTGMAMIIVSIWIAVSLLRRTDDREPKFFLVAFGWVLLGGFVLGLNKFGFVARTPLTEFGPMVGDIAQLGFLSLGLADRLNTLQAEKQTTEMALEKSLANIQVQIGRSKALEERNNVLHVEMEQASSQLVQAEKLSSLGQNVAGILHEISSPLSHAVAGARGATKAKNELYEFIESMVSDDAEAQEVWAALRARFNGLAENLGYVDVGLSKIHEMNHAVRNYSRTDGSSKSSENIQDLLQEVCVVMRHKVKYLNLDFDCDELPEVVCHRSQLGQVFTNLLGNAADAIEERQERQGGHGDPGHIRISGKVKPVDGHYGIEFVVEDNGTGVPQEIRDKIFDAFFTTKPVGQGTGLGMAITTRIILNHGGTLNVGDSTLGGAAMRLWIAQPPTGE